MTDEGSGARLRQRWLVIGVRRALTMSVVAALVGFAAVSSIDTTEAVPSRDQPRSTDAAVTELMEDHRCSTTGFGDAVIPPEAILRLDDGHTRVVSFDRGWASFTGKAPGTLVAVCLGGND